MKRILLLVILALTICCTAFANEQAIVDSFKTFVPAEIQVIKNTYPVLGAEQITKHEPDKYNKETYYQKKKQEFSYDILNVEKTDSLMYPYMGYVLLEKKTTYYKRSLSQLQATKEIEIAYISTDKYRVEYSYDNGSWNLAFVTIYDEDGFAKRYKASNEDKDIVYKPFYYIE